MSADSRALTRVTAETVTATPEFPNRARGAQGVAPQGRARAAEGAGGPPASPAARLDRGQLAVVGRRAHGAVDRRDHGL